MKTNKQNDLQNSVSFFKSFKNKQFIVYDVKEDVTADGNQVILMYIKSTDNEYRIIQFENSRMNRTPQTMMSGKVKIFKDCHDDSSDWIDC